jgi:hypothetical protein
MWVFSFFAIHLLLLLLACQIEWNGLLLVTRAGGAEQGSFESAAMSGEILDVVQLFSHHLKSEQAHLASHKNTETLNHQHQNTRNNGMMLSEVVKITKVC